MGIRATGAPAYPVAPYSREVMRIIVALIAFAPLTASARLMAQTVCRPADAVTSRTIAELATIVSGTDSAAQASRDSLHLAATLASKVTLVTNEKTCKSARDALNRAWNTPGALRQVYVYQIGQFWSVEDPQISGNGEYRGVVIYDGRWRYQSTMATL